MLLRRPSTLCLIALFATLLRLRAADPSGDTPEPGSREAIAAATTEPRFSSPWVESVPDSDTVPSPTKYLGHIAGAPGELTGTEKIYGYYRALAAASPRVKVEVIGHSEEGREIILVIVGEADSLAHLADARAAMAALADPRRTNADAMEQLIGANKPFYMLHGGLHSGESGSPEMLMELAYRLAVSEAPLIRQIRAHVTVLINPCAEPDGRDRMVDWFYLHLKGKTDYENLPPLSPPFWGKYVAHDNNRDGIQRRLALTRATQDAFLKWHPVVVHDLHESIPLLSIWTGTGPYDPNLDPIATTEWHALSFHQVTALTGMGMPGVWTWGFGEGWAHIYADSVAINHNAIGFGYETFGNATAETVERVIDPDQERFTGKPVTEADWYRVSPPPAKKFKWSLRDNTNYMETGVLSALEYTAQNGPEMLRNFWRRGRNAVHKGESEKPYAIVIPENAEDPQRVVTLVELLRAHGIEVTALTKPGKVKQGEFKAGTLLVRMDQPYRGYALDLLTPQKYPAESAPYDPYDDVGWSLPETFGVEVLRIDDPAVRKLEGVAVGNYRAAAGKVSGSGDFYLLHDGGQESLLAARVQLAPFTVEAAEKAFSAGGVNYPAGSWVIADQPGLRPALEVLAGKTGLNFAAARKAPEVMRHALDLPRIAVLQTWSDTQAAGWVRLTFDEEKIPYAILMDDEIRRGHLRERYDLILYPDTYDGLKDIVGGINPKFSPLPYEKSAKYPSLGSPASSPDITGGLTWAGLGNLEAFVREGGLLVTLGNASVLALDGGIARDIRHARVKNVSTPGSVLRARFRRAEHPLAYGYPESIAAFREDRTVYETRRSERGRVVLQWGATLPKADDAPDDDEGKDEPDEKANPLVISGGIKGAAELEGKPAIFDIPTGKGRVLAFDFDPIHRTLMRANFRLVWNAILNWNDLPPTPKS